MVKNRFYHIKKKNILQSLLNEVETNISLPPQDIIKPVQEIEIPENPNETVHYFVQKGSEIHSQRLKIWNEDAFSLKFEEQLFEKISPLGDWDNESNQRLLEEDNGYSLTSFMGYNRSFGYF